MNWPTKTVSQPQLNVLFLSGLGHSVSSQHRVVTKTFPLLLVLRNKYILAVCKVLGLKKNDNNNVSRNCRPWCLTPWSCAAVWRRQLRTTGSHKLPNHTEKPSEPVRNSCYSVDLPSSSENRIYHTDISALLSLLSRNFEKKNLIGGWRDGSLFKSTVCSCKRSEFNSKVLQDSSGLWLQFQGICRPLLASMSTACMCCTYTHAGKQSST